MRLTIVLVDGFAPGRERGRHLPILRSRSRVGRRQPMVVPPLPASAKANKQHTHDPLHSAIALNSKPNCLLKTSDDARASCQRSTSMAQVVLLAPASGSPTAQAAASASGRRPALCVVNTHLFGHPDATHVRLFQTATFMRHIERISGRYAGSPASADSPLAVVVCGDFNSQPEEGVRDLMTKGYIASHHNDWQRAARFRLIESRAEREANWFASARSDGGLPTSSAAGRHQSAQGRQGTEKGGPDAREDYVAGGRGGGGVGRGSRADDEGESTPEPIGETGTDAGAASAGLGVGAQEWAADLALELSQGIRLEQGCRDLPFTFCTATCSQVVDYIYFSPSRLRCDPDLSPFPSLSRESVTADTAIPSVSFPSDHIALVQDLVWTLQ